MTQPTRLEVRANMKTTDTAALLPCAFCDFSACKTSGNITGTWCHVYCPNCAAEGPARDTDEEAIAAWNRRALLVASEPAAPFQERVQPWMLECFGPEIAADKIERNHRFFEEATEAVQANGMTRSEAHQLVDYTFDRPIGELRQEIGGVMVTLAALCLASGQDMHAAGETELARIWTKVEAIRAKQAAKPKHSPLPAAPAQSAEPVGKAVPMPGASGFTMAVFEASEIPVGTDLYAAPQPSPTAVVLDDERATLAAALEAGRYTHASSNTEKHRAFKDGWKQAMAYARSIAPVAHIASVYEDKDGPKYVQFDVEDGEDIPAGTKLYAALQPAQTAQSQKVVAWMNPSTGAILHEESKDMGDTRRTFWTPLVAAQSAVVLDDERALNRYEILNEAGEALLAAEHTEAYEVIYRMMKEARAASPQPVEQTTNPEQK